jgi:hypothetical protein
MSKSKRLYKLMIDERISYTAYILANDKDDAKEKAIIDDIHSYCNQDFEQKVLRISRIFKKDFPNDVWIND